MSEPILLQDLSDHILTLTLNRPESRNALNPALMRELQEALLDAEMDARVRCIVLRGAAGQFCSGGDIAKAKDANGDKNRELSEQEKAELAEKAAKSGPTTQEKLHQWIRRNANTSKLILTMAKPVIAQLEGSVAGAGIALALACDFRVAANNVKMVSSFINVGYSGDFGISYFLTKVAGITKAKEVMMLNRKLTAEEMNQYGLVTKMVSPEAIDGVTRELAMQLASSAPIALGYMKKNIYASIDKDIDTALDIEANHQNRAATTEDSKEALKAFFEKRSPVFVGK